MGGKLFKSPAPDPDGQLVMEDNDEALLREAGYDSAMWENLNPDEYDALVTDIEKQKAVDLAHRQKTAVNHVVENLFFFAPVKIKVQHYPPGAPKSGQSYLWLTLDENALLAHHREDLGVMKTSTRYPSGVAIDEDGNVYVSDTANHHKNSKSSPTRKIDAQAIMDLSTTNTPPLAPAAPTLIRASQDELEIGWHEPRHSTIDRFDVQYRRSGHRNASGENPNPWLSLAASIKITRVTQQNLPCHSPYQFRVRAHNPVGWGEYSSPSAVVWTKPGVPENPLPPFPGVISNTYVCLYWSAVQDNGSEIRNYHLQYRQVDESTASKRLPYLSLYKGSELSYVVGQLEPTGLYYFRLQVENGVGTSHWIETKAIRTAALAKAQVHELPVELWSACSDRWVQCWDPKTEQVFYFNKLTCQRVLDEPKEVTEARERAGQERIEDQPEMKFRTRRFQFLRQVTHASSSSPPPTWTLTLNRKTMYAQTFQAFQRASKHQLQVQKPKIIFEGEPGIDSGGLTKDWILSICHLALDPSRFLFTSTDSGQWIFREDTYRNPHATKEFRFLGKFVAKCILDRQTLDLPLHALVWKHIVGHEVSREDLKTVDAQFAASLDWIESHDITDVIFETFSIKRDNDDHPPHQANVDLIERGHAVDVREDNKFRYVECLVKWKTEFAFRSPLDAFIQGFETLVPRSSLSECFAHDPVLDLMRLVNGEPEIGIDVIRSHVVFQGGYDAHSQVVLWLWQALREFRHKDRALFLKFVTGTTKVPLDGFDPPFNITCSDLHDEALPRAHTCFNQLVLPDYRSYETLVDKILFAILNTEGFELS